MTLWVVGSDSIKWGLCANTGLIWVGVWLLITMCRNKKLLLEGLVRLIELWVYAEDMNTCGWIANGILI